MLALGGVDWYSLDINPEPWVVGNIGVSRRDGKLGAWMGANQQLATYQEAVREVVKYSDFRKREGDLSVTFYFWRRQDDYELGSGKRHRKHVADATNMQKATEDALQGILFDNDRSNRHVQSYVMEQGPDVRGMIVVSVESFAKPELPRPVEISVELMKVDNYERKPFIEEDRPDVRDVF